MRQPLLLFRLKYELVLNLVSSEKQGQINGYLQSHRTASDHHLKEMYGESRNRTLYCRECHERFRADKLIEDFCADNGIVYCGAAAIGDWYFTGDYPTPGGYRVLRRSLENHLARRAGRSY